MLFVFAILLFTFIMHVCVQLHIPLKPRSWHIARPVYKPNSTECDVVIFGGNVHIEGHHGDRDNTADLQILSSGKKSIMHEVTPDLGECTYPFWSFATRLP